ncbi:MAG: hypothetical protein JSS66_01005 [Armatimonadetes bacterium]|nr:hypothetical protein [Armatimonadota bacterium]
MKDLDKLIEIAFDGDESAQAALMAASSYDQREELQSLVDLKQGLRKLREVPECQLTTERLRSAVLRSAAPRRPQRFPLWYAPLAAAAAFGAFLLLKGNPQQDRPISLNTVASRQPQAKQPVAPSVDRSEDSVAATEPANPIVVPEDQTSNSPVAFRSKSERVPRHRSVSDAEEIKNAVKVANEFGIRAEKTEALVTGGSGGASTKEASMPAAPAGSGLREASLAGAPAMVVVTDTKSPETGAASAKEVSVPRDVVFGG